MDFQKLSVFFFILSYSIFCHLVWNGCYNAHSCSETEVHNSLYNTNKKTQNTKLVIQNNIKLTRRKTMGSKTSPCPILPKPIKSIFHLNWFRKSPDLFPISIQLYSMFDEKNNTLGFILISSAIFTIIEWMYIIYLLSRLLWDGIIKPIFKIIYLIIFICVLMKISVMFLPYTKSYISQDNYQYISSMVFSFYNITSKLYTDFGILINNAIKDDVGHCIINRE
ncbi:conserved Plasmodium protein, unknown function [Plasmodium berghei]|uniref:Uncharacterized protein n=2 Tax=Plasmodium berghei TaxID=5821 RepID=A0A509AKZ7_PLABA|nr:conserved Plasmodium protein, unknown function [Plasmodium berghei ANKA]CXI54347.1 conserved Plasmodium protein, unknown function [Plasmodium berghei]SCL94959.1 conserved Plasmodium protein, unknown function [Plasmodium berghei]SCM16142.1 conserved Plasmodium protein, unknown function [Plasmodium berghei]SCM17938.1 conserved Plasmodium protein, unknown function [Plasmodium berghei]SCN26303.1 conserved Plasmodium protein, unknown function [Plasmodium berghei]|eukprot:XP_034422066.1 conserved Plasmodium protein, unknown function [Plasmodium berghei ANKA]